MAEQKPLDWIKQVDRILFDLEEKPQFGLPASFNWKEFEQRLQNLFERSSLKVKSVSKGWMNASQLWEGLGDDLLPLTVEWTPLASPAYFITTGQDLKQLMADLFGGEKEAAYFYDASLVQGFYHYFAAEILQTLDQLAFAPPLAPRLGENKGWLQEIIGEEPCFVIDLSLSFNGQTFWGRVLLPEGFRRDWKNYFSNLPPSPLSEEMREKITVDVRLEVGHTALSFEEWRRVSPGDFVLLDRCSYDPLVKKGGLILTLDETPLFRGRFKEKGIKLTEYPIYGEATHEKISESMEEEPFDEEEPEDLYGDQPSDLVGEEFEEEEEEETLKEAELAPPEASISAEELPIHLTVEVGRLRMSAKELMDLTPGNLLEINVSPDQGVDLVINGKKVGRGELIRLGETLGVRILSL